VIVDEEDRDEARIAARRAELAALKLHPRDDSVNAALLARTKRCYEAHLGEVRLMVGGLLSRLESAFDSQDPRTVSAAREEVTRALDELEGESFL
jgi:molecular chaperone HscC